MSPHTSPKTEHKEIRIDGMTCDACRRKVADALNDVEGVRVESVELGAATITTEGRRATAAARLAIDSLGYSARPELETPPPLKDSPQSPAADREKPTGIARAAVQGARDAAPDDQPVHPAPKKKVGDAGRDDRDRGEPMPERVNGIDEPSAETRSKSGPRPANRDKSPTTNPGRSRSGGSSKR